MPDDPIVPLRFPKVRQRIDPETGELDCWPIEPVVMFMVEKLGVYDHHENPSGYCSAAAELHTGIHRTSWQRYVKRGFLTAEQADLVATKLGRHPSAFWPDYGNAIEPDTAFLKAWDHAGDQPPLRLVR